VTGTPSQVVRQVRYQNTLYRRTPSLVFFTFALPLLLFFLFKLMFDDAGHTMYGRLSVAQFYGPSLASYGVISGTYTYLAINTATQRDEGILKRIRGTPLRPSVYVAGRIGSALCIAAASAIVMLGIAWGAFDLGIALAAIPAMIVSFAVGTAAFAALGLAVSAFCPNGDAAPGIANATLLPLVFVSSIFIPLDHPGTAVRWLGDVFPVKPFSLSFQHAVHAHSFGAAFEWWRIGVLALWGAVATVTALRFFKWEPKEHRSRRPTRAARRVAGTAAT
jgi:ABC-2 type transport system permease protein